jgi:hypothetical protein
MVLLRTCLLTLILDRIGSPGIDKSWTLIYALQQAFMYNGAFVVFTQQQKKQHFVCTSRRNNEIFAWSSNTDDLFGSIILRHSKQALVLFDPKD